MTGTHGRDEVQGRRRGKGQPQENRHSGSAKQGESGGTGRPIDRCATGGIPPYAQRFFFVVNTRTSRSPLPSMSGLPYWSNVFSTTEAESPAVSCVGGSEPTTIELGPKAGPACTVATQP